MLLEVYNMLMKVFYVNNIRSKEEEYLTELDTVEEVAEYILSFLDKCEFKYTYIRYIECEDYIGIDFGSYYQFYRIYNVDMSMTEFAQKFEKYKNNRKRV